MVSFFKLKIKLSIFTFIIADLYLNSQQDLHEYDGNIFPSQRRRAENNDLELQSLNDLVINISFARAKTDQFKHGHNHHKKHHSSKHRRSRNSSKNKRKRKSLTRIN